MKKTESEKQHELGAVVPGSESAAFDNYMKGAYERDVQESEKLDKKQAEAEKKAKNASEKKTKIVTVDLNTWVAAMPPKVQDSVPKSDLKWAN